MLLQLRARVRQSRCGAGLLHVSAGERERAAAAAGLSMGVYSASMTFGVNVSFSISSFGALRKHSFGTFSRHRAGAGTISSGYFGIVITSMRSLLLFTFPVKLPYQLLPLAAL